MPTLAIAQNQASAPAQTGTPQPPPTWARAREATLSAQVSVLMQRRDMLAQQARAATGATRAGLESQVARVNVLIAQAQADLDAARRGVDQPVHFSFDAPVLPSRTLPRPNNDVALMGIAASTILLLPFVLLIVRRLWHRGAAPVVSQEWKDTPERLRRLEQAVDTIAVEVERISESQRFTTRLLADGAAALGNGASPIAAPVAVPVSASEPRRS